ncbi:ribonuclease H-like domain-containing protein [Clostridium swellfunianum]|uniref:ribonuclease H-like domain-containing protein n=1 Tax=Clostridium swellfunianum TaxID=1367462 RepID=UPI00202E4FA3|nr:ribonuclease H-like domain-containing protein [Clostridium swellfunianum]
MIARENEIYIGEVDNSFALDIENRKDLYKNALFFDLEHYVYKKPICVGVFGCCYYDEKDKILRVTQYMIENKDDAYDILVLAKDYFDQMLKLGKKYIVTFSGNNDYTIINYLFNKYKMDFNVEEIFKGIDLQKEYEKVRKTSIGLKALEKEFGISRDSELISGANLAKTFHKIMQDEDYVNRMPEEKKEKILLYNDQDVVSLFHMFVNWNSFIRAVEEKEETEKKDAVE